MIDERGKAITIRSRLVLLEGCFRLGTFEFLSRCCTESVTLTALREGCSVGAGGDGVLQLQVCGRERRRDGGGPQVTVTHLTHVTGHRHLLIAAAGAENIPTVPAGPRERESEQLLTNTLHYIYIYIHYQSKVFCSPSLHLFDPKYSKSSQIEKYFYDL